MTRYLHEYLTIGRRCRDRFDAQPVAGNSLKDLISFYQIESVCSELFSLVNRPVRNFEYMSAFRLFVPCLLSLALSSAHRAAAQFEQVYIGVNGLTCSQCTRTVEMSIRKLDFVADVDMNLQHTEGRIALKKNSKPDMDKIAQAVVNAGFSVRYLTADLLSAGVASDLSSNGCFVLNGDTYAFVQKPTEPLKGTVKLRFIGKKFMPKKEFSKVATGGAPVCTNAAGKVYTVTMVKP